MRLSRRGVFRPAGAGPGSGTCAVVDRPEHRAAGSAGPAAGGAPGQLPARPQAPARPGQLRAPAAGRCGGGGTAERRRRAADRGEQPLPASGVGRAGMPGPSAGAPAAGAGPARVGGRVRIGAAVRRAGRGRGAGLRRGRAERRRGRPDRAQAGRPAAGDRAGRGAGQAAVARGDLRAAGAFAGAADRREP